MKSTPFSNMSECESFMARNCEKCLRYVVPADGESWDEVRTCPIEQKIAASAFDRAQWPEDDIVADTHGNARRCRGFYPGGDGGKFPGWVKGECKRFVAIRFPKNRPECRYVNDETRCPLPRGPWCWRPTK